ncbi:MAG: transposase, partial [Desulfobacterales bacterium]
RKLRIKLPIGRPITRPESVIADASYDSREIREYNKSRGIKTTIPVNKRNRKKPKIGRPFGFDKALYMKRYVVERFFSWVESYKKIFPRYERLEDSYLGLVQLMCVMMLWKVLG